LLLLTRARGCVATADQAQLAQGLRKYTGLGEALDANLARQREVLSGLEASMRGFGSQLQSQQKSAQQAAAEATATLTKFGNVEASLAGGVSFYVSLQDAVRALQLEVRLVGVRAVRRALAYE
jgi:ALIX V-shaped domain binding to HIV